MEHFPEAVQHDDEVELNVALDERGTHVTMPYQVRPNRSFVDFANPEATGIGVRGRVPHLFTVCVIRERGSFA